MMYPLYVSIPSRGFWFFEDGVHGAQGDDERVCFNPLAGILVF